MAGFGKLEGIAQQVQQHLLKPLFVGVNKLGQGGGGFVVQRDLLLAGANAADFEQVFRK
jgi:hypothetical protein